jgi:hypothetical protein
MSDAAEYRLNARLCAELAETTQSVLDRQIWRRMQLAWLELAVQAENWPDPVATAA